MAEHKNLTEAQKAFKDQLSPDSLRIFNEVAQKPFPEQAVFFLNAFWHEFGNQAEFVYSVAYKIFMLADMKAKGTQYVHLYEPGADLDFDMGLYFFEQLTKFVDEPTHQWFNGPGLTAWSLKNKKFKQDFEKSLPKEMTAMQRKKELRERVDVNFDGRVSFLEYLLYQYDASPKELMARSMNTDEHPEIRKARLALLEVRKAVAAYEEEKRRLTEEAKLPGVKGLKAKNLLAQLDASPLWDKLNKALITAEAAVRIASRKFGAGRVVDAGAGGSGEPMRTEGAIWWMERELAEQQEKYGNRGGNIKRKSLTGAGDANAPAASS